MELKVNNSIYNRYIKRLLDIVFSLVAIFFLSILLFIIATLVRVKLGSPVLFKQERPGLNEKVFLMYKFRTMTNQRDELGNLLPDEVRLTKFGRFLRAASLDELPELINVLKGDMSLIGPRPLLVEYLSLYSDNQRIRHVVRPGLSGLAQINGRNSIGWEEKFNLDVEYVKNISLKYDFLILIQTIKKVILREGINSESAATVEPFEGNKSD
jgi:undecaprenyl phosphate N,N'-diacetylbacillosamine 1-phosphate transferase